MNRWIALLLGVACFVGAVWVNAAYEVDLTMLAGAAGITDVNIQMPNWLPTGTAFGLSIAGGLCVLGACMADCNRPATPPGR